TGYREGHALEAAAAALDGRGDADDFAFEIHERSPAVAGIHRCVGLNEIFVVIQSDASPFGADNARRDRAAQPEWSAECQHAIADLHRVAVAEFESRQWLLRLDADDGEIGFLVGPELAADEFSP